MSKSELMKWAHRWAKEHRGEFEKYADALSVGMKKAYVHKAELEEIRNTATRERETDPLKNESSEKAPQMEMEIPKEEEPEKKPFSFSDFSRRGVPLLLQNWLDPAYPYRKDFRELSSPPRDREMRSAREGERLSL